MLLSNEKIEEYIASLTRDPSRENAQKVFHEISKLLSTGSSIAAQIDLICDAVEPVHPDIREKFTE